MTETEGSKYEQVVARRLSRADKLRERQLGVELTLVAIALYIIIVEVAVALALMWRIVQWMNGGG